MLLQEELFPQAALILEKAGFNPHNLLNSSSPSAGSVGDGRRERSPFYCCFPLPPTQPTVQEDGTNLAQRLFIVCQPSGVSEKVLRDAFCRFGNLIDVYLLSGMVFLHGDVMLLNLFFFFFAKLLSHIYPVKCI